MDKPTIIEQPAEKRQIAKVMEFPKGLTTYIKWDQIALTARELGSDFEAHYTPDGAWTVTLFWHYEDLA